MIYFFGTRASKIKQRKLRKTVCPYCSTQDSFVVSTYSRYFHFFWIPIIPLFKTNVAECSHCKKSYSLSEFTPEMQRALDRENQTNPAKRPLWQGCGCIILVLFFTIMMSLSFYGVYLRSQGDDTYTVKTDARMELLLADMDQMSSLLHREKDSVSFLLKECVDYDLLGGLDTKEIGYFTKQQNDKLLVLLRVENIKKIKPEFRKDILTVVEDCLSQQELDVTEIYIGIEGRWNTVLVKTPTDADLSGRFADKNKLLPFYGDTAQQADTNTLIDSSINLN
ncbi:zinc-ribbon domain-containing protein [Maribacter chungangensis]|uniref:Zinc-ribbon domain-containing protein n=1 Tax=Maribacter chungangensis TaxID=1069117 RepID=A0ABW3AZC0_9FLAO